MTESNFAHAIYKKINLGKQRSNSIYMQNIEIFLNELAQMAEGKTAQEQKDSLKHPINNLIYSQLRGMKALKGLSL